MKANNWKEKNEFPPVGETVNFWHDERSNYFRGFVVYSGDKGATVDIGYLISSGEPGDFAEFTEEDQLKLDKIEEIKKIIWNNLCEVETCYELIYEWHQKELKQKVNYRGD